MKPKIKLSHTIHSIHHGVTVSTFSLEVRPDRRPVFSVPRTRAAEDGRFKRIVTTDDSIYLIQWGRFAGTRLIEYPEDHWPGHLRSTTAAPGMGPMHVTQPPLEVHGPTDSILFAIAHSTQVRDLFQAGYFPSDRGDTTTERLGKISPRLLEPGSVL